MYYNYNGFGIVFNDLFEKMEIEEWNIYQYVKFQIDEGSKKGESKFYVPKDVFQLR